MYIYIDMHQAIAYFCFIPGTAILVKPITDQGSTGTSVYFPGKHNVSTVKFLLGTVNFLGVLTGFKLIFKVAYSQLGPYRNFKLWGEDVDVVLNIQFYLEYFIIKLIFMSRHGLVRYSFKLLVDAGSVIHVV